MKEQRGRRKNEIRNPRKSLLSLGLERRWVGAGLLEQDQDKDLADRNWPMEGGIGAVGGEVLKPQRKHSPCLRHWPRQRERKNAWALLFCFLFIQPPGTSAGSPNTSVVFWDLPSQKQSKERAGNSFESKQANDWSLALIVFKIVHSSLYLMIPLST